MDRYYFRRVTSWIAVNAAKGLSWEEICAKNAALKAPRPQEWLDQCRESGMQAAENSRLIREEMQRRDLLRRLAAGTGAPPPVFPPLRICDITGCKFPKEE